MMEHVIGACAGGFYAAPMADEINDFFAAHPLPSAHRKIAQVCSAAFPAHSTGRFVTAAPSLIAAH
jgi:hypothetical protein